MRIEVIEGDITALAVEFPAISCGVYGTPPERAVPLAVATVRGWRGSRPSRVAFACFGGAMASCHREAPAATQTR